MVVGRKTLRDLRTSFFFFFFFFFPSLNRRDGTPSIFFFFFFFSLPVILTGRMEPGVQLQTGYWYYLVGRHRHRGMATGKGSWATGQQAHAADVDMGWIGIREGKR
jgi:hypothetical protein